MKLLVCVVLLLALLGSALAETRQYGIMIDAGSTGSRIYIYSWTPRNSRSSQPPFSIPVTQDGWSRKVTPGLSDFAGNPDAAGASLAPLLDFAVDKLKGLHAKPANTPLYLGATAGLRMLPTAARDAIIESVRAYFHTREFDFEDDRAKIISGEEEGIYGWLTVNYLLKNLPSAEASVGALDLGGASAQITFAPDSQILSNYFPVRFQDFSPIRSYTHSFLQYGLNEAGYRVDQAVAEGDLRQPCLPTGRSRQFTLPNGTEVTLAGASDPLACSGYVKDLLYKDTPCPTGPDSCSINGVYQPPLSDFTFYAFSAFASVINTLRLAPNSSLEDLGLTATLACAMDYEKLNETYGPSPYLDTLCFGASFSFHLLHDGYGFPAQDVRIMFRESIDDVETGWALGAILFEANLLPFDLVKDSASCAPFDNSVDGAIVGLLVVALACAFLWAYFLTRRIKMLENRSTLLLSDPLI